MGPLQSAQPQGWRHVGAASAFASFAVCCGHDASCDKQLRAAEEAPARGRSPAPALLTLLQRVVQLLPHGQDAICHALELNLWGQDQAVGKAKSAAKLPGKQRCGRTGVRGQRH